MLRRAWGGSARAGSRSSAEVRPAAHSPPARARRGADALLFARGKRPPIIVGESLVPAVVPFLRDLGDRGRGRGVQHLEGGRHLRLPSRRCQISFRFAEARGARTTYSYNVPRDRFDATAGGGGGARGRAADRRLRAARARRRRPGPAGARAEELARQVLGAAPDLIVDATGRARTIARLLDLPAVEGPRKDTALHAHCTGYRGDPGQRAHRPARARLALADPAARARLDRRGHRLRAHRKFGNSAEEQFDSFLRRDDCARQWGEKAERITPVVRYTNYQLAHDPRRRPELGAGRRRVRLRRSGASRAGS